MGNGLHDSYMTVVRFKVNQIGSITEAIEAWTVGRRRASIHRPFDAILQMECSDRPTLDAIAILVVAALSAGNAESKDKKSVVLALFFL